MIDLCEESTHSDVELEEGAVDLSALRTPKGCSHRLVTFAEDASHPESTHCDNSRPKIHRELVSHAMDLNATDPPRDDEPTASTPSLLSPTSELRMPVTPVMDPTATSPSPGLVTLPTRPPAQPPPVVPMTPTAFDGSPMTHSNTPAASKHSELSPRIGTRTAQRRFLRHLEVRLLRGTHGGNSSSSSISPAQGIVSARGRGAGSDGIGQEEGQTEASTPRAKARAAAAAVSRALFHQGKGTSDDRRRAAGLKPTLGRGIPQFRGWGLPSFNISSLQVGSGLTAPPPPESPPAVCEGANLHVGARSTVQA